MSQPVHNLGAAGGGVEAGAGHRVLWPHQRQHPAALNAEPGPSLVTPLGWGTCSASDLSVTLFSDWLIRAASVNMRSPPSPGPDPPGSCTTEYFVRYVL